MPDSHTDLFKNLAKMVDSVADLDNLLGVIVLAAMRVMNAKGSSLLLVDKTKDKLYFHTCIGDKGDDIKRYELGKGEGIAGWVAERGESLLIEDVTTDPRWSPKIARSVGFETRSIICAPLKVGDEVLGVLEVIDRADGEPLSSDDLERLEAFSDLAAGLLLKARIYREVAVENKILKQELGGKGEIIGQSQAIQAAIASCRKVASSNATTLITGESGTGKELFARLIHNLSPRCEKPMVVVNCGSVPEPLLERELFGNEKGAYTGADTQKPGLFEVANGGAVFLDEIGETSQAMQVKLLRVLQEGTFFRLGGQSTIHVDVRVIAATNKRLEDLVEEGRFREDLFYRLNVIRINLPPLRERSGDVELLAEHFARNFAAELGRPVKGFTDEAMKALKNYSWPGNARQLENTIERAVIMGESESIGLEDLPPEIKEFRASPISVGVSLKLAQDNFKREFIKKTLDFCDGNKTRTAAILDIQRTYLSRLIKELGIS